MRKIKIRKIGVVLFVLAIIGCAKVSVETVKPIKVDINMRVDIYQHVVKDVESIEGEIYGNKQQINMNTLFLWENVYAAQYSSEVSFAIEKRKARAAIIEDYFQKGYIGENKEAYLEIVSQDLTNEVKNAIGKNIEEENSDRKIIYLETAGKNGITISEAAKVFFNDHYNRAQPGYWFQVYDEKSGKYTWIKK